MVIWALLGTALPRSVPAQAVGDFAARVDTSRSAEMRSDAVTIPDSVRLKVGYQHWKGGAIGTAAGAVAGLLLDALAHGQCQDCPSSDSHVVKTALAGAGLGGAFGFLVGAASPKYRWVARPAAESGAQ